MRSFINLHLPGFWLWLKWGCQLLCANRAGLLSLDIKVENSLSGLETQVPLKHMDAHFNGSRALWTFYLGVLVPATFAVVPYLPVEPV